MAGRTNPDRLTNKGYYEVRKLLEENKELLEKQTYRTYEAYLRHVISLLPHGRQGASDFGKLGESTIKTITAEAELQIVIGGSPLGRNKSGYPNTMALQKRIDRVRQDLEDAKSLLLIMAGELGVAQGKYPALDRLAAQKLGADEQTPAE
jgi:hypothetical protein